MTPQPLQLCEQPQLIKVWMGHQPPKIFTTLREEVELPAILDQHFPGFNVGHHDHPRCIWVSEEVAFLSAGNYSGLKRPQERSHISAHDVESVNSRIFKGKDTKWIQKAKNWVESWSGTGGTSNLKILEFTKDLHLLEGFVDPAQMTSKTRDPPFSPQILHLPKPFITPVRVRRIFMSHSWFRLDRKISSETAAIVASSF